MLQSVKQVKLETLAISLPIPIVLMQSLMGETPKTALHRFVRESSEKATNISLWKNSMFMSIVGQYSKVY
ncbi:hypothetical protein [Moorena sp. SIO3I8]|uniref:hypothetical protein n=1 Tax=Moorena sp. SIO3I8 TaxID=2607833 RepID=UPI0025D721E3|nr:hypothetical protein [Moorena sp. SIO3I8]